MVTILLADDTVLFKALEGTSLRRGGCALVKAPLEKLHEEARQRRPGAALLAVTGAASADLAVKLLRKRSVAWLPLVVLRLETVEEPLLDRAGRREGTVDVIDMKRGEGGEPDYDAIEGPLDAIIARLLTWSTRKVDRVGASVAVRLTARGRQMRLKTKDISPTGLFIKTRAPLPAGRKLALSMVLPSVGGSRTEGSLRLAGTCEVVRGVSPEETGARADLIAGMGVRFLDLEEESKANLREWVSAAARGARPVAAQTAGG